MAKLYYRAEGSQRPAKKKRYLAVTKKYRLLFWVSLIINYGLMAYYHQPELKIAEKAVKGFLKRYLNG